MKKIFTLLFLFVLSTNIFAQTSVSGDQSGTWTKANSPYLVTDTITVPTGDTLKIEAGVTVNFQGHYKLYVQGVIEALGTETDSILFTADNHTNGWFGIHIETSKLSKFSYCKFEYGFTSGDNYPAMHGGAIRMIDSDASFDNCVFSNNNSEASQGMGGAIYGINTSSGGGDEKTTFTNCKFTENKAYSEGGAIKFTSDLGTVFTNCEFLNNSTRYGGGAVMGYSVIGTTFIKCLFIENYSMYSNGGAIETLGSGNTMYFKNCTMYKNDAVSGSGGAGAFYYATIDFVNCIISNNTSQYDDDNVYIDAGGSNGTVNYCNIIMPEYNTTGANNINVSSLFVDADNGNFHLQQTSPCIDAGTDIGLAYFGDAPDMGCFEFGDSANINIEISDKNISIYPNPVSNLITVKGDNIKVESIEILDLNGKLVLRKNMAQTIDISSIASGVYFVKINTENSTFAKKIIKK